MKKNMLKIGRWAIMMSTAMVLTTPFALTSCKENISEDAYAVKKMKTMTDYISEDADLSEIKSLFDEVKLGRAANASVLTSVLSARGNYTVFAPTNEAVKTFIQKYTNGQYSSVSEMPAELHAEVAKLIALNCVIDNGSSNAYEIAEFPTDGGTFSISNLNDRRLACQQDSLSAYIINGDAKVTTHNIEVSNGMLHIVDHVIAPSTASVAQLVTEADNMKVMGSLLSATGWEQKLAVNTKEEEAYEEANMQYAGSTRNFVSFNFPYQEKRSVGYTMFVETDDVFKNDWQIEGAYDAEGNLTNNADVLRSVEAKCQEITGNYEATGDYTNPNNALNQFVAYHILDGGMATDELVHHHNEYNYDYGTDIKNPLKTGYSVNVWDYYVSVGDHPRMMKITQLATGEYDYYINRLSTYDNRFKGTYEELGSTPNTPTNGMNIKLSALNGDNENNGLNGFYFPIDHVLIFSPETATALSSERIRFDVSTMLPELASNDLRGRSARYFPNGYFKNIMNESQGTKLFYLKDGYVASNGGWKDYQGDEILVNGRFDFVYRLPRVPKTGTYEIRMGASLNQWRGMVQVYFGDTPHNTEPVGLPIDQRESVSLIPGQPWVEDTGDEITDRENDRNLRNQGYMKAPNYFTRDGTKGKTTARNADPSGPALRRILTTCTLDANKTYYLRFKSAIESDQTQFMFDYIEFVPSTVVNGATPEDIW